MFHLALTEELEKQALEELNETPEKREEIRKHLIEWIHQEPHVKFRTDGLWLLNFIRGTKFSTQKTKQKILSHLTAKVVLPELFSNRDPLQPVLQDIIIKGLTLPFHTPDKNCVLIRAEVLNSNHDYFEVGKLSLMIFEILLNESESILISGNYVIIDMKKFPLGFLKQVNPTNLNRLFKHTNAAYPNRIKLMAFINCINGTEQIFNIAKPFIPTKILNRVVFYGENYSELYRTIPQTYFPKEYGGSLHSISDLIEFWKNKLESNREWFMENDKYSFDSDQKLLVLKDANNMFGTEGSFRRLEVD
ncbi:hypothetical protein FQR65_LT09935 [Abscondita terminalis]|nr:hypothetical protein FQR65_LT09935 [Abscondita terminalis]